MEMRVIGHSTPEYLQTVALRHRVLRDTLGIPYSPEIYAHEETDHHLSYWQDGEPRACLVMTPKSAGEVKLRQMAVDFPLQNQGIGTQLVQDAEEFARAQGYTEIMLHARGYAIPFYEKLGYVPEGEEFTEVGIPHRRMRKHL